MSKTTASSLLRVATVHYAEVAWFWDDAHLHDSDFQIDMCDAIQAKVCELEKKYEVRNDTSYCTQFEGTQLYGDNAEQVQKAGQELAAYVAEYGGVISIND